MKYVEPLPAVYPEKSPHITMMWREGRYALEWLQGWRLGERVLAGLPTADGRPLMLLPGYDTHDRALQRLRDRLCALGYDARTWGLGRNHGRVPKLMPLLQARLAAWQSESGRPIGLVGWSLGGFIARELARDHADLVASVLTLGTPAVGGPKYTITAAAYRKRGFDLDRIEADIAQRDAVPIQCPLTVVYSRCDGVVSWPATLDRVTPQARHVEVACSHLGLVNDPAAFRVIARALADQLSAAG